MNFTTFDLNLLRVLDAILRESSTVRAGERLGMSQSAVSGALARLRHALGDQLFVRQGQGLSPTDYARSLALPVHEELDRLERLLAGPPSFDAATASLSFKLAGSDFFAECLMPRLGHKLQTLAPGIRVQLVDLVPQSYVDSLERYDADMALVPDADFPDWVERKPFFWSGFTAIARKDHPEIKKAHLSPGEVMPLDLFCALGQVLFSPEGKLRAMGDAALASIGRERKVAMTMPVFSGVCRAVGESDLIALVPRQFAEKVAPALGLELYALPFPLAPALIVGVWHKRSTANSADMWMRNLVASALLTLNEGEDKLPD